MQNRVAIQVVSAAVLAVLLPAQAVYAATTVDVTQLLINISNQLGPVQKMMTGAAYVMGIALFFKGLYHLKIYGELRTMMASQTSLKQPLTYMCIGAVFLYMPTALEVMLQSTFGDPALTPFEQWVGAKATGSELAMRAVFRVIQVVGLFAFLRGWMLLVKSAQQGAQSQFGKGLVHIVGGIFAMNVIGTANVLSASLGVKFGF